MKNLGILLMKPLIIYYNDRNIENPSKYELKISKMNITIMSVDIDYEVKYIKYKTKYLLLKSLTNHQHGGINFEQKQKQRREELIKMKTTNSYIPRTKLTSKPKVYQVHDNGGRPFQISIDTSGIDIQKINKSENYDKAFKFLTKFDGYWFGYDTSIHKQNGNSLLIKLHKHKYMYIGSEIYEFDTTDEIIDYFSHVGNSDVPYPVAIGTQNIYFMLDCAFISINNLQNDPVPYNSDILYGEFYNSPKKNIHKMKCKKIANRIPWWTR